MRLLSCVDPSTVCYSSPGVDIVSHQLSREISTLGRVALRASKSSRGRVTESDKHPSKVYFVFSDFTGHV